MMLARKAACFAAAALAGVVGALVSLPAGAQAPDRSSLVAARDRSSLVALTASMAAPPPRGAVRLGPVTSRQVIRVEITLKVAHPAALSAFVAGVSDRRSPLFHHFLRPGQFGALFGPPPSEVSAVRNALRSAGLSPGRVTADRLAIPVTASAASIGRAFGTALVRYRLPGGRVAYANTSAPRVPAAVAPYIDGVLGLSDVYRPRSLAVSPRRPVLAGVAASQAGVAATSASVAASPAGPKPCPAATAAARVYASLTADKLASYYKMPPLYGLGDLGQGVRVALAEFGPDSPADIAAYRSCYGLSTPVSYVPVAGGAGTGTVSGQATLDIENVMGLAPRAAIDVYQAPDRGSVDTYNLYSAIVNKPHPDQVVSTSWGLCELDGDQSLIRMEAPLFVQAALQGQTVFAAAGDFGSTGCLYNPLGFTNGSALSVTDPASQPYVVGVGGTSIGAASQSVWNNSSIADGAGAGGLSADWCMPGYQDKPAIPGLISGSSATAPSCVKGPPYRRQVPDVSADADPQTGYVIYFSGMWQSGWGGTSAAASLWAAVAALTDASPFCRYYGSGDAGVRPAGLYAVASSAHSYIYSPPAEVLSDVTRGGNDYTPSGYAGGKYPAARGYDMASGLGTPLVSGLDFAGRASTYYPGLAALMCWEYGTKLGSARVTGISPRQGSARRSQTVTVSGSGFLPIAGADIAEVGRQRLAARCTSTTRCTVVLPPAPPGTVNIRISVEDLTLSPVTRADRYRYL
jgi:Pro-kumamolisin, activation domain